MYAIYLKPAFSQVFTGIGNALKVIFFVVFQKGFHLIQKTYLHLYIGQQWNAQVVNAAEKPSHHGGKPQHERNLEEVMDLM